MTQVKSQVRYDMQVPSLSHGLPPSPQRILEIVQNFIHSNDKDWQNKESFCMICPPPYFIGNSKRKKHQSAKSRKMREGFLIEELEVIPGCLPRSNWTYVRRVCKGHFFIALWNSSRRADSNSSYKARISWKSSVWRTERNLRTKGRLSKVSCRERRNFRRPWPRQNYDWALNHSWHPTVVAAAGRSRWNHSKSFVVKKEKEEKG